LDGSFINTLMDDNLNATERSWIVSLSKNVTRKISLLISLEDFKKFFKAKQERTSSSPSGRHMGHYKTMLECIRQDIPLLPDMIVSIAYISLITETPLYCWQTASQVMIERGKGRYVEDLRIIQLCKALFCARASLHPLDSISSKLTTSSTF
jgi:hypothetical protein